jgi:hypothetical protein
MTNEGNDRKAHNLAGCTVYLSGPMDFLAQSREEERVNGWRARVKQFLERRGVNVLDPWYKPEIRALHGYGKEDDKSTEKRNRWTFGDTPEESALRAEICHSYWPTLHIDLRMVDKSDFLISFCPTNTYSVGTVHEIALARQQHKPVLFVSPPIPLRFLTELSDHLLQTGDQRGQELLQRLRQEQPMKENPNGAPSLWYMGMLYGDYFFDSFGFEAYREQFGWKKSPLDEMEQQPPPRRRSLLPYLDRLDDEIPKLYDSRLGQLVTNDDWLIFDKHSEEGAG